MKGLLHPLKRLPHPMKGLLHPLRRLPHPLKGLRHPVRRLRHPVKGLLHPVKGLLHPVIGSRHPMKGLKQTFEGFGLQIDLLRHFGRISAQWTGQARSLWPQRGNEAKTAESSASLRPHGSPACNAVARPAGPLYCGKSEQEVLIQ